jgi:outer membrane lipoprotein-sorting protein
MNRILLLALLALAGCTHGPLPTIHWTDRREALRILSTRAHAVRTVSAQGLLTLTRPDHESARLDAAIASQPPDRLRLRAWKLGRAIFDLTLTGDGLWLFAPDEPSLNPKIRSSALATARLAKAWSALSGGLFDRPDLSIKETSHQLIVTAPSEEGIIRCEVDKRTLTPSRYIVTDATGRTRFALELDDYRLYGDIAYPQRLSATSDMGTILIQLRDVELNADLAAGAFVPPRRAEKLP